MSQQDTGGQKGVDFGEPDTLLGTALSSQDGNKWSGRNRAARTPSSRISSRQTAGKHRLARGCQVAGAVEEPIVRHIILFPIPVKTYWSQIILFFFKPVSGQSILF